MSAIYYHRYELTSRAALNARSTRKLHPGALILHEGGYGCLHPWPELGDAPLEEQLHCLSTGIFTPLASQALHCCAVDAAARKSGANLFVGLSIPPSHATLLEMPDAARSEQLSRQGFQAIKVKVTPQTARQPEIVEQFAEHPFGLRLRLDFNGSLDAGLFQEFASRLSPAAFQVIDFIEDPCPFDADIWRTLRKQNGLPLAVDLVNGPVPADACDLRVYKPACQQIPDQPGRFVITSYMDHPVGQLFAAWEAAQRFGTVEVCGLLTHRLFEPNEFSQALGETGPELLLPAGKGLGWDELLEKLPWKRLVGC